ncbi:hypothetical protein [Alsobacter sp. R-9]
MTSPNETPSGPLGSGRSGTPGSETSASTTGGMTEEARRKAYDLAERARETAAEAAEQAKSEAGELAERAKRRAIDAAEEGKSTGANRLEGVAHAAHAAADALEDRAPEFAPYAHRAAESIEEFSRSFRTRSITDMLQDANAFARREPVAVFGATLIAGFAIARFLSSAPPRHREARGTSQGAGSGMGGRWEERGEALARLRGGSGTGVGTGGSSATGSAPRQPGMTTGPEPGSRSSGTGVSGRVRPEERDRPAGTSDTRPAETRPGMARGVGEGPPLPPMTPGGESPMRGTPGGEGGISSVAPSSGPGSSGSVPNVGGTAGGTTPGSRRTTPGRAQDGRP